MKNKFLSLMLAMSVCPAVFVMPTAAAEIEIKPSAEILFYSDETKTELLSADALPGDSYVYYNVLPSPNCFVRKVETNASYIDGEKLMIGEQSADELIIEPYTVLAGDANFDSVLNTKDLVSVMRYLSGDFGWFWESINYDAIDLNGNGDIDVKDLIRVMKLIAGESVEFPEFIAASKTDYSAEIYYSPGKRSTDPDSDEYLNYLTVIHSPEELSAYFDMVAKNFDLTSDFTFSSKMEQENYEKNKDLSKYEIMRLTYDKIAEKYNAEFFEKNTLITQNHFSFCDGDSPTLTGCELRGDRLTLVYTNYIGPGLAWGPFGTNHQFIAVSGTDFTEDSIDVLIKTEYAKDSVDPVVRED